MERLWAPWRIEYILNKKSEGCIFCLYPQQTDDRDSLILHRSPRAFVMLNRYPYTNGHLLVAPYRHISDLNDLAAEELLELMTTVRLCCTVLQEKAAPQGFNIGMNLGKAAGAGVDDHLHLHIVPRWNGDTNFMSVIDDVRVMPENLLATYDALYPGFAAAAG